LLTYADLLLPDSTAEKYTAEFLNAKAYDYNLAPDSRTSTKYQRKLLREIQYLINRKGTPIAVQTLVEAMTGFNADVTINENLMLSNQDSNFRNGVGGWQSIGQCNLHDRNFYVGVPTGTEAFIQDSASVGQVAIGAVPSWIENGVASPITRGVPVTGGTEYTFSYYQKKNSGTVTVTPKIHWYDSTGMLLRVETTTGTAVTTSWAKVSLTKTAMSKVSTYLTKLAISSSVMTVTVPSTTGIEVGDPISVTFNSPTYKTESGVKTVTAKTGTTLSFATSLGNLSIINMSGTVTRNEAVYAGFSLHFDNAITTNYSSVIQYGLLPDNYVLFDAVQFAKSSATSFSEARGIKIRIYPAKTNVIYNPSFESNTTGWVVPSGSTTPAAVPPGMVSGTQSLKSTITTSNTVSYTTNSGDISSGKFYTFSFYAKSTAAKTGSIKLTPIDGSTAGTAVSSSIALTTSWTKYSLTEFIPETYVTPKLKCEIIGDASGFDIYVDAVQLEAGYSATDYFDGSMGTLGAAWAGTANTSKSYIYPNKDARLTRLFLEIKNWLPINTPYVVTSESGIETVSGIPIKGFSS
jgi:hypothetical protein